MWFAQVAICPCGFTREVTLCPSQHLWCSHPDLEYSDSCHCPTGFMVVSALPNDSQYVSPASTKAPSPMASRGGSFTGTPRPGPAMSGPSDQSEQSTGRPADTGDTASSGERVHHGICSSSDLDQSEQSTGRPADTGDTASSGDTCIIAYAAHQIQCAEEQ